MVKKIVTIIILLIIAVVTVLGIGHNRFFYRVSYSGHLKVEDSQLKNRFGENIQLRGLSSHGIQWDYNDAITKENLKYLRDEYDLNVFRIAMYTEEDGYIDNKEEQYNKVKNIIELCKDLDIYTIVDWHILKDGNPRTHQKEAEDFFDKISSEYKNTPNIIYEICNEPNGDISWEGDVYPYAEDIIKVIRKNSEDSIIIVGLPDYAKDVYSAIRKPLNYKNIMYSFHFYAATHGYDTMYNLEYAIKEKVPLFVTEWGTSEATGSGKVSETMSKNWINKLNENNISWINWSYSYKDETSAMLDKSLNREERGDREISFEDIENNLTESGKIVINLMKRKIKQ